MSMRGYTEQKCGLSGTEQGGPKSYSELPNSEYRHHILKPKCTQNTVKYTQFTIIAETTSSPPPPSPVAVRPHLCTKGTGDEEPDYDPGECVWIV